MGKRKQQIKRNDLSRFLFYILGHAPHEFGLVPDSEGFVTYKELLQAIHEEPEWRYVRRSHINEILLGPDRFRFDSKEKVIRVTERRWSLDSYTEIESIPKCLFTPVRRKAHPVVMEKGLKSREGTYITLSSQKEMALRIGQRRDQKPVLLEIQTAMAQREGVTFQSFGGLFLCDHIPPKSIVGPPVSIQKEDTRRVTEKKEKSMEKQVDILPGTFILDPNRDPDPYRRSKGKKRKGWKEAARKAGRGKRK